MIKRWIDDLDTSDRCMNDQPTLTNEDKVIKFGPWLHRFLVLITILITISFQEQIVENLQSLDIENNLIILIIQFVFIIFIWGTLHKILRLS